MTTRLHKAMAAVLDALNVRDTGDFCGSENSLKKYEEKMECLAPLVGGAGADAVLGPLVQRLTGHQHTLQQRVEDACARYDPQPPTDDMDGEVAVAATRWRLYSECWARSVPKELYDALESACETANTLFPQAKVRMQSGLCKALDWAFAALEGPTDFQRGAAVEHALRYCPKLLIQRFQPRLKAVKEVVMRPRETVLREIKAKADAGQLIALVDQFVDCGVGGKFGPIEAVRNEIRRLVVVQATQVATAVLCPQVQQPDHVHLLAGERLLKPLCHEVIEGGRNARDPRHILRRPPQLPCRAVRCACAASHTAP